MTFIEWLQERLHHHRVYSGPIDGVAGTRTYRAIERFQRQHGIPVTGTAGEKTVTRLRLAKSRSNNGLDLMKAPCAPPQTEPEPVWMARSRDYIGLAEGKGAANNPEILDWAEQLDLDYQSDDIPWCGLFVAAMISSTLPNAALPGNPLGAREWLRFGRPVDERGGAIVVFWRHSITSWKGHVGFVVGGTGTHVACLGGNQSNKVNIRLFPRDRVLGYRWPAEVDLNGFSPEYGMGCQVVTPEIVKGIPVTEGEQ